MLRQLYLWLRDRVLSDEDINPSGMPTRWKFAEDERLASKRAKMREWMIAHDIEPREAQKFDKPRRR